ncbi:MAG: TetR/AcrR family transcriptional regulator [Pseudomonadota bacterium]
MARPNLKSERREQILDAFERCVARYGLSGATLDLVSEEAGLARPLIRHNVGNREDLIEAFIGRFLERSDSATALMIEHLPDSVPAQAMVNWLFQPGASDNQLVLVSSALIMAGAHDAKLARMMRSWMADFIDRLAAVLRKAFPKAAAGDVQAAAAGIAGIYFTYQSMVPLGPDTALRTGSHEAALKLLKSLET